MQALQKKDNTEIISVGDKIEGVGGVKRALGRSKKRRSACSWVVCIGGPPFIKVVSLGPWAQQARLGGAAMMRMRGTRLVA
jgi:hypothetical protein